MGARKLRLFSEMFALLILVPMVFSRGVHSSNPEETGESNAGSCVEVERQALLKFKQNIYTKKTVDVDLLPSWGGVEAKRDCCKWHGVTCANKSGHVIMLDLSDFFSPSVYDNLLPKGNATFDVLFDMSPSLVDLRFLEYLDLSQVPWRGIPSFIGNLSQLRYLNLSSSYISGEIPPHLGNLSRLQSLDLRHTGYSTKNYDWIFCLSSLRELDLSFANLSKAKNWVEIFNKLPYLTKLSLAVCELPNVIHSSLSLVNSSTSLAFLDLSSNYFNFPIQKWTLFNFSRSLSYLDLSFSMLEGSIPDAIGYMTALNHLDISFSELEGSIPDAIGYMTALSHLYLTYNKLEGSIPDAIGNMTTLSHLSLSDNKLEGSIPDAIGNMTALSHLYLSENKLEGSIPDAIWNMAALNDLDLSYNKLEGALPKSFWNLCALRVFHVAGNNLSKPLPEYNQSLSRCKSFSLEDLDLSQNPLEGVISEAHLSKLPKLSYLDLSYSSLNVAINSNWIPPFQLDFIILGSCRLGSLFPKWLQTQKKYQVLDISNSGIADSFPDWFWGSIPKTCRSIDLSNNQIHGKITNLSFAYPHFYPKVDLSSNQLEGAIPQFLFKVGALNLSMNKFSEMKSVCDIVDNSTLSFLDISSNQLSGELPNCWSRFSELRVLILNDNRLSGKLPASIGSLTQMSSLHLRNNTLMGSLPSSLGSCTNLTVLDVGENNLSGPIPTWIGKSLPDLVILILRSNSFSGSIPFLLCHLAHLQVLDLSQNNLSHIIPKCVGNFSAMKDERSTRTSISQNYTYNSWYESGTFFTYYDDEVQLLWKGTYSLYGSTLRLVKSIDVSSNNLSGGIPIEITDLVGLVSLNLSRNKLSGQIPLDIGKLGVLDVLDLSNNKLSDKIPSSLSNVHRLNTLDLSNNSLSGRIPTGTQLQSFNATVYMGNPELCGDPLPRKCPGEEPPSVQPHQKLDHDAFLTRGFYVSMGLGFMIGFWGACGTLIFIKSWRYAYFKFWDGVQDTVYVMAELRKAKIMRIMRRWSI